MSLSKKKYTSEKSNQNLSLLDMLQKTQIWVFQNIISVVKV